MDDATIIKALRACGKNAKCSECPLHGNRNTECFPAWTAAADRIEALSREVERLYGVLKMLVGDEKAYQEGQIPSDADRVEEIERLTADRDAWQRRCEAAVIDMHTEDLCMVCKWCKRIGLGHYRHEGPNCEECMDDAWRPDFEWRGLCNEPCAGNGGRDGADN